MRDLVASAEVRARAGALGITPPMQARLGRGGLLARPRARGRGQGRGADQLYPARVLDQLAAVAAARRQTDSLVRIRHAVWYGGHRLEDWRPWRRDRVHEFDRLARAFDVLADLDEDGREREAAAFAEYLASGRVRWFSRRLLRHRANRQTWASLMLGLSVSGGVPFSLDQPVDDDVEVLLGEVLERGFGWRRGAVPEPAGRTVLAALGLMGDPRETPWRMAQLQEPEAERLRDGLRAWTRAGIIPELTERPVVAGAMILTAQRIAELVPAWADGYSPTRGHTSRESGAC